jgi:hypothetical protein
MKAKPEEIRRLARGLLDLLEEDPGLELMENFAREEGERRAQFMLMMLRIMAEENPYDEG